MPFVTRLTLQSGDRETLERVVTDIKERAERKGVELRGPNPEPQRDVTAPQYRRLDPDGGRFEGWTYPVYVRSIVIVGYDEFARNVAGDDYPSSIHIEADIEQVSNPG
jgi:small subunit ribosomal protein S10